MSYEGKKSVTADNGQDPPDGKTRAEKDPVCGMEVDPEATAGSYDYDGHTYFFCSRRCLEAFRADSVRYLVHPPDGQTLSPDLPRAEAQPAEAGRYTCPMHPEVRRPEPGSCPKCGMALDPLAPMAPATPTQYVYPMHPEIAQEEPGSCSLCGMALVSVTK